MMDFNLLGLVMNEGGASCHRKKSWTNSPFPVIIHASGNENLMSEFKFSCSHCGQRLQCDEAFSGRQIQCPSCKHLIRVPSVPGQTVKYQPQSGMTWATHVPPPKAPSPKSPPPKDQSPEGPEQRG
jgi:DNA-directed RNA polymerase subunit RPC12/RpoP